MPLGQVSPPANRSTAGNNGDSTAPIQIPLVLVLVGDNLVKRARRRCPRGETDTSSTASGGGDGPLARNKRRQQRAAAAAGHTHVPPTRHIHRKATPPSAAGCSAAVRGRRLWAQSKADTRRGASVHRRIVAFHMHATSIWRALGVREPKRTLSFFRILFSAAHARI